MVESIYKGQCEIQVKGWYSSAITGDTFVNGHQRESGYHFLTKLQSGNIFSQKTTAVTDDHKYSPADHLPEYLRGRLQL